MKHLVAGPKAKDPVDQSSSTTSLPITWRLDSAAIEVRRGDNLWRISQRVYGKGLRYTVIYGANQEQIRNPDLTYPGQVFVLPNDEKRQ